MLQIEIPGREQPLRLDVLVLDYNGTIACDGQLIDGIGERIRELCTKLPVYILTADTYGTVKRQCEGLGAEILTFPRAAAGECKEEIVRKLSVDQKVCVVGKRSVSSATASTMFRCSILRNSRLRFWTPRACMQASCPTQTFWSAPLPTRWICC